MITYVTAVLICPTMLIVITEQCPVPIKERNHSQTLQGLTIQPRFLTNTPQTIHLVNNHLFFYLQAPILISCAVWATLLVNKHMQFQCDNLSLVAAINKGSAKDTMVMHLLRCLWFLPHPTTFALPPSTFRALVILPLTCSLGTRAKNSC